MRGKGMTIPIRMSLLFPTKIKSVWMWLRRRERPDQKYARQRSGCGRLLVARMLEAGEDPRFIARRIAILASEDIGNADPNALLVAAAAYDVVIKVGMPEAQLTLGQAAIYMATAPKSNASAMAIWEAMKDVREGRTLPVPRHLRDTHYKGAAKLGHGEGYKYAHDFEGGHVEQDYLGVDKVYYTPTDRGFEATIARRMEELKSKADTSRVAAEEPKAAKPSKEPRKSAG